MANKLLDDLQATEIKFSKNIRMPRPFAKVEETTKESSEPYRTTLDYDIKVTFGYRAAAEDAEHLDLVKARIRRAIASRLFYNVRDAVLDLDILLMNKGINDTDIRKAIDNIMEEMT